eukprot:7278827-Alexandrium_andersonii.AAC.1
MGLLTAVPIPVALGATHSDTVDAGDAGVYACMPKRRASAIPGPCCTDPKGVDALAGGLCAGALA